MRILISNEGANNTKTWPTAKIAMLVPNMVILRILKAVPVL